MPLERNKKDQVIKEFKIHAKDTGSTEVQIAPLTERRNVLREHFNSLKRDLHSRR